MKTVPNTSFSASQEEFKLVINLIESATVAVANRNVPAALRDIGEARSIIGTWEQSSLAGHLFKRIDGLMKCLANGSKDASTL
jgi:hypothetical protein